jgi:hypothetical protein
MSKSVEILEIGTYVGKTRQDVPNVYVVLQSTTYQEEAGQFVTKYRILEVSDEGDDLGKEPITVNSDEIAEI